MKRKFLTVLLLLIGVNFSHAQMNDAEKKATIKKDNETYLKNGGVINDELIAQPTKKHKVVAEDGSFIIHPNNELERGETQMDRDYKELVNIKDQNSYEYANKKELFLQKYPEMKAKEFDGKVEPRIDESNPNK
jgi:phage pi2 protein 07